MIGNNDFSTAVRQAGFPQKTRDGDDWTIIDKYLIKTSLAESTIPDYLDPWEVGSNIKLRKATISTKVGMTNVSEVTLEYSERPISDAGIDTTASVYKNGDIVQSATLDWQEVPIDDPRIVASGFATQAKVDADNAAGILSYGVGGIEYIYETHSTGFVWSQANIITSGIGKTAEPLGMTSPTKALWLLVGTTVQSDGYDDDGNEVVAKRYVYKYSVVGWNSGE